MITGATITGPKGTMRGAPASAHSSSNRCFCTAVQPGPPNWLGQPVHLFTFVLSGGFLWSNRHLPGAMLVALGAGMNLAAIAANNGTMPASEWAWRTAGFPALIDEFEKAVVAEAGFFARFAARFEG